MALNSMTGYARHQGQNEVIGWTWEIKSVNSRGLEVRMRLPAGYDFLEMALRERLQKRVIRSNVTVSLTTGTLAKTSVLVVNEEILKQYTELASQWGERLPSFAPARIDGLLGLRGVVELPETSLESSVIEAQKEILLDEFSQALNALMEMRIAEGRRLGEVLLKHLDNIVLLVHQAEGCVSLNPEAIRERLRIQIDALLEAVPALDAERLSQEAALIAAKADVREELDRLSAHVAAARDMLASGEAVGRRLDFLCQEFNREANTLCSKAGDLELTRIGLSLKAVIEQFREQVQNIE